MVGQRNFGYSRWMNRLFIMACALSTLACTVPIQHGLDEGAANDMLALLDRAGIAGRKQASEASDPPRFAISVPQADAPRALEVLKAHGLPRAPQHGFDEVYGQASLIPTASEERARYLRAMTGELESTIAAVDGVVSARVHVVPEERDSLAAPQDPPRVPARAAVLLRGLDGHPGLSDDQAKVLVSGAVPGLTPQAVSVVRTYAQAAARNSDALVAVGPLRVAPGSRGPLILGLIIGIALLALMACLLLVTARRLATVEQKPS